jgi:holin-like protein
MKETAQALGQLALLWAIHLACNWIAAKTGLPVPGNVLGVVVLFLLLCSGVVKLRHVERAADFLLKHLVFFFTAVAVGLMEWWQPFRDYGATLFVALTVSAVLPLLVVGGLAQALGRRRG